VDDRLNVDVVVDPVVGQSVLADLTAADIHIEMLADAVVTDVSTGGIVRGRVGAVEVGDVLPHTLVDVIAVLALETFERADVLGREPLGPRARRAARRASGCLDCPRAARRAPRRQ
jgi:hypothetical protein